MSVTGAALQRPAVEHLLGRWVVATTVGELVAFSVPTNVQASAPYSALLTP